MCVCVDVRVPRGDETLRVDICSGIFVPRRYTAGLGYEDGLTFEGFLKIDKREKIDKTSVDTGITGLVTDRVDLHLLRVYHHPYPQSLTSVSSRRNLDQSCWLRGRSEKTTTGLGVE